MEQALYTIRGNCYMLDSDYGNAVLDYKRASEMNPNDTPAWIDLFKATIKALSHDDAVNEFDKISPINPEVRDICADESRIRY